MSTVQKRRRAEKPKSAQHYSPPKDGKPQYVAAWWLAIGCHPVAIHAGEKKPIGKAWGLNRPTIGELQALFARYQGAGVGVCLGPEKGPSGSWLVDLEGDGEQAEDTWLSLVGGEEVQTIGWKSARGRHRLFIASESFLSLLQSAGAEEGTGLGVGVYKLAAFPDLEWRIGGWKEPGVPKQIQSVCPPTAGDDGRPREWSGAIGIAEVPDALVGRLEAMAEQAAKTQADATPPPPAETIRIEVAREALRPRAMPREGLAPESRAALYLNEIEPAISGSRGHDKAFYTACKIGPGFNLDIETALRVLAPWNASCQPPWSDRELRHKLEDAYKENANHLGWLLNREREPSTSITASSVRRPSELAGPELVDYATMTETDLGIVPMTSVKASPIDWMWKHRIARGELTLLAGEGGLGKSQLLLAWAAAISTGARWWDGSGNAPLGSTLILAAEDSPETTIKPRLMAMGADMSRIFILKSLYTIRKPGRPDAVNPVHLQDLPFWSAVLGKVPDLKLLMIDPLASYLGRGVNDSKNNELRAVLEPFIDNVIRPRGISLAVNAHLNKSIDIKNPTHRINGSVAYSNLARNVHFVIRNPDDPTHRIYAQVKCNNAPDDLPAIGFRVEGRTVDVDGQKIETATPVFDAETLTIDVREAMSQDKAGGKRGPDPAKKKELAIRLVEFMKDRGLVPVHEIFRMAGSAGYLGAELANGKWSQPPPLYRAKDYVPELESPHDGWEIVSSREDPTLCDIKGGHRWLLRAKGSPF